jgi:hypothetical protein
VQGQMMTIFEGLMNQFFMVLKVKYTPKKHWSDSLGSKITTLVNDLLLQSTHDVVIVINFLFVDANEVTTLGNAS